MRRTQFKFLDATDQQRNLSPARPVLDPKGELIDLPSVAAAPRDDTTLTEAIGERRSEREYLVDSSITQNDLSYLLWATQGVKEVDGMDVFKTVPSAGARHPIETYLLLSHVEDLPAGLYRYVGTSHQLEVIRQGAECTAEVAATVLQPDLINGSAAAFIWTAVAYRMTWRYGDRGYRYIHLDAGHVAQNLYLAAQAVPCGVCTSAAFRDDELNRVLGLDGNDHFAVYFGTVGK